MDAKEQVREGKGGTRERKKYGKRERTIERKGERKEKENKGMKVKRKRKFLNN